jgi:hypothetical protein
MIMSDRDGKMHGRRHITKHLWHFYENSFVAANKTAKSVMSHFDFNKRNQRRKCTFSASETCEFYKN